MNHVPPEMTVTVTVGFSLASEGLAIEGKITMTTPVPGQGLANAQAALTSTQSALTGLTSGVATFITDSAQAILNALGSSQVPGDSDAAVQDIATGLLAVGTGMTTLTAQLAAADPITNPAGVPPVVSQGNADPLNTPAGRMGAG